MGDRSAPSSGFLRRLRGHVLGQAAMFTVVGAATTLANAVLYLLLRGTFSAEVSNVLSVLTTTIASSLAHRWWVFSDRAEHPMRMHLQTLAVFGFYCASNQVALWMLGLAVDDPSSTAEAVAVAAMALFGGTSRFLAMRLWVFARRARVLRPERGSGRDRGVVRERPGR